MLVAMIATLSLAATDCGVTGARGVVDFDILQPPGKPIQLPQRLTLTFNDEEVIARRKPSDYNLLDWRKHGPDPSDVTAWSHFNKYYPDIRRLKVRGRRGEVVVDLRDVRSVADPEADALAIARGAQLGGVPSAKFTGGTLHLCWLDTRAPSYPAR